MATNIEGVFIKEIVRHKDERGYFAELMKAGEPGFHSIAQTSYAICKPGVIKAFHYHDYSETWVVLEGEALAVLYDIREGSPTKGLTQTLHMGEGHPVVLSIAPGIAHGYKAVGEHTVGMLYHAEEAYDPMQPEQIQIISHDAPEIGFDWNTV